MEDCDDIARAQEAADRERLMVGLMQLTGKIIATVETKLSEKIVQ